MLTDEDLKALDPFSFKTQKKWHTILGVKMFFTQTEQFTTAKFI